MLHNLKSWIFIKLSLSTLKFLNNVITKKTQMILSKKKIKNTNDTHPAIDNSGYIIFYFYFCENKRVINQ